MTKRIISVVSLILVGLMMLGIFAACGQQNTAQSASTQAGSTAAAASTTPAQSNVTLTVAASQGWIRDIDKQLASKFTDKTGIKVDIQANPDNQYANVVKTKLAAGEGPDIFYSPTGYAALDYNPQKYALDLSGEAWVANYPDYLKPQVSVDNKVIGFCTWGRDTRSMLYNSEIFTKYNVKVPTSYAEFKAACNTLLKNGVTPVYFPGKEDWYDGMTFDGAVNIEAKAAGSYDKLNKGELKYADSAEAQKYLSNLLDSAKSGYFGKNFMSDTYDKGPAQLSSGKYAMWYGWSAYANDIAAAGGPSADTYLAFPAPWADTFDTLAMTGAGEMRMINKDSKNVDAAKQYFNFLAEAENLQTYYDGRPDLLESTMKGATAKPVAAFTKVSEMVNGKTLLSPTESVKYTGADVTLGKDIQNMLVGAETPKQVLQAIDDSRSKILSAVGSN